MELQFSEELTTGNPPSPRKKFNIYLLICLILVLIITIPVIIVLSIKLNNKSNDYDNSKNELNS